VSQQRILSVYALGSFAYDSRLCRKLRAALPTCADDCQRTQYRTYLKQHWERHDFTGP
jgi:hypothetical protein